MEQHSSKKKQQEDRQYYYRRKEEEKICNSSNTSKSNVSSSYSSSVGRLIHPCLVDCPLHQLIILEQEEQQQQQQLQKKQQLHATIKISNKNEYTYIQDDEIRRPNNSPSDFIIFKIPNNIATDKIIGKIHGEAMSCASFAVIKPFCIFDIIYYYTQQQQQQPISSSTSTYPYNFMNNDTVSGGFSCSSNACSIR